MLMKKILLLFMFFPILLVAQEAQQKPSGLDIKFNASYYGNNLWNPGLKVGAAYIFKETHWDGESKKGKEKHKMHQFMINGDLGFFWDPKDFTAVFTYFGVTYRKTNTKGFNYNFGLSPAALYRSFLPETWEVDDEGNVSEVVLPGRFYYAPTLIAGIGKKMNGKTFSAWFMNLNIMTLVKYNANMVPLLNVEFGYRFN
jgi:hypothetical protein